MSDDLISRNIVIAIIESKRLQCGRRDLSAGYKLADAQEQIMNLPASYDVEKVVDQITNAKGADGLVYYVDGRPTICKEQAVEIIRQGGH